MDDRQAIESGRRAANEYDQTQRAFDSVLKAILDALVATPPDQTTKIAKLHMAAQNLEAVRKALFLVIADGETAQAAIAMAEMTRP